MAFTKYVEYHSMEWMLLVETGWITMYVDTVAGKRMATMLFDGKKR